ncbi:hypothetical protein [Tolypothrix sp. VBCCA 56010]|uniref:hypothetical protein n=1 Tax=Tolypothrix sp. VBCCA 56010 TaxID=3137731 RepID=UPI003D7D7EA3
MFCSDVRNTLRRAPIFFVTSVDILSVFIYLYIVWFFHADLLKVKEVVFPKLSFRERDILLEEKLTFAAAKNYTQKLGVLGTQRVHSFLKQAHGELDKVGLLP